MRADSIEVRVLVHSSSAAATSNLCADLREKLIAFLQQEYPEALPRRRNEIVATPPLKDGGIPGPPVPAGRCGRCRGHPRPGADSATQAQSAPSPFMTMSCALSQASLPAHHSAVSAGDRSLGGFLLTDCA